MNNCPNCGAPIKHYYNYNCEYCGTFLKNTNEEIKHFKNVEIGNIHVDFDISPEFNEVIFTIRGTTFPKFHYCEEFNKDLVVSSDDVGKNVGYRISFDLCKFVNFKYDEFLNEIYKRIPEYFAERADEIISNIINLVEESCIHTKWRVYY